MRKRKRSVWGNSSTLFLRVNGLVPQVDVHFLLTPVLPEAPAALALLSEDVDLDGRLAPSVDSADPCGSVLG